jgi:CubicO group peptidase (beta-lactamase class C family)/D-alanyl-D-alanine dipeptidase
MRHRLPLAALGGLLLLGAVALAGPDAPPEAPPRADYADVAARLERLVRAEMEDKKLPALSLALVDGQETVWARGFGHADPDAKAPATAETVYRVGSVSKLFTDLAVMQLVEQGRLDLDAPVSTYLPDFQPRNPFGPPVTLRMLMSHRAGLVREPPVGNYFVPDEPSLAETVKSLNSTELVYAPGHKTKYSNAGIATVGYVLERTQGQPFAPYVRRAVLEPLGLGKSSFEPQPEVVKALARAYMWTYDGRVFEAPKFQLGMAPAGSMYSTVTDLGRFLSVLFAGGRGPGGPVVKPETLQAMWTPQFAPPGQRRGFGIGFHIGEMDGRRLIGHDGAIYGFATTLMALPDDGLGVVAVTTLDCANDVVGRIASAALRLMRARKAGQAPPVSPATRPIPPDAAKRLTGRYAAGDEVVELAEQGGQLFLTRTGSDMRLRLRMRAGSDTLVTDDVLGHGQEVVPGADSLILPGERRVRSQAVPGPTTFRRVPATPPAPAPDRFRSLIGEYGWDHDVLYVYEHQGKLHALIEWFTSYPLIEESPTVFRFPDWGLYDGERLVFERDSSGRVTQVVAANVTFKRRPSGPAGTGSFRIEPVQPVARLREQALAAQPPTEKGEFLAPDLVELTTLDPTIRLDIRYAGTDNFLGTPVYTQARAFLQRPAAEALVRAHRSLARLGYGLLIHDAYRPWYVTKVFWDATPPDKHIFVADPSQGSRHNRGCAVDLTLYERATGRPAEMPGGYDEMSERSFPEYPGGTALQRWHRERLRDAMEAVGFDVYEFEWWHFDHREWRRYPILNLPFERLVVSADGAYTSASPGGVLGGAGQRERKGAAR